MNCSHDTEENNRKFASIYFDGLISLIIVLYEPRDVQPGVIKDTQARK